MNLSDLARNAYTLRGPLAKRGCMRWFHSFSGRCPETGESRTFFVEFLTMNPGLGGDQPIFGQHPYYKKRGMKPSYVCVKAGVFPDEDGAGGRQLHAFYPISSLKASSAPLVMQVEDCFCSEERIRGAVSVTEEEAGCRFLMSDAGVMEWDLEIYKAVSCHTGILASRLFQFLNALESYWHGEGIKSFFRGKVTLDGTAYDVAPETSFGYSDKHWGGGFNRPLLQLACGKLTSVRTGRALRHSVLAVSGCCPRLFFLPLRRRLMLQLTYTGEDFCFGMRPSLFSRCKWEAKEGGRRYVWHIVAKNRTSIVKISCSCTRRQMIWMKYETPDGMLSRRPLMAGAGAIGTIQIFRRTPGGKTLLDTLHMAQGFCAYQGAKIPQGLQSAH